MNLHVPGALWRLKPFNSGSVNNVTRGADNP